MTDEIASTPVSFTGQTNDKWNEWSGFGQWKVSKYPTGQNSVFVNSFYFILVGNLCCCLTFALSELSELIIQRTTIALLYILGGQCLMQSV